MKHIILSFAAFAALNADDAIINHSTTQQNQSQQEEYETELKPILSPLKSLLEENTQEEQVESNENNDNKDQTKQYDFSGYIGIFNKTNLGSIKDNYNNFSASIELGYNIQNTLYIEPHFLWTLGKKCIQLKILVAVLNCLYIYAYIE